MSMCDGHTGICANPNCGQEYDRARGRNGLCPRCTSYYRKHQTMRPAELRPAQRICSNPNCGRDISLRRQRGSANLCKRCHKFKARNGVDWQPEFSRRPPNTRPPVCAQCKSRPARYTKPKPQCRLCHDYWKRNGKFRPRTMDADKCKVCGVPRRYEPKEFIKGRCRKCYKYWYDHGKMTDRPEHLWNRGKYGYCECSAPATHKATIRIHGHLEEMPLCTDCYAEHQRQVAWYGDGKPTGTLQQGKRLDVYGDD